MTDHASVPIPCDPLTVAYLRMAGDACAFIETNTSHAVPDLLAALHS
ncbi:MAG: hypothetical protein H7338_08390, partial [Candidatus Sericytochromatia bacterium]|nr:hypothetical protein [Candidatus Sericytochromatia bacterium]